MDQAEQRRNALEKRLQAAQTPLPGSRLAGLHSVSRQVIVHDMALLRARGAPIIATPRGYVWQRSEAALAGEVDRVIAVNHGPEDLESELNAIVDEGGYVLDVIVEHGVYGELRGLLMIQSRAEVRDFLASLALAGDQPLLTVTGGTHLHTIRATPKVHRRINERLRTLGYLVVP